MALKHHKDDKLKYYQQVENSRNFVLPFIEQTIPVREGTTVLEIGTGEGGVLVPFAEKGAICLGVDLDNYRINKANEFHDEAVHAGKMKFLYQNVYDADFLAKYKNHFDIIVLKDTIEHIPDQERFIPYLRNFVKAGGAIFFGFPPWYMPFGGHQQTCEKKLTSKLPYYHILPWPLYKGILKMAGESESTIGQLKEIVDTQITIERFERIVKKAGYTVKNKQHYLFNPIYRYKFGVEPRKQLPLITAIPYVRDFLTTCVYYTIG